MHVKAAVEQPIFVKPLAAIVKRTAPAMTAQPIDKAAISKLATALREQARRPASRRQPWRDAGDTDRRSVAGCAPRASSPSPRATSRPRAPSSSAPPRLATLARWLRSATRSIRRLSAASAWSGSRAMKPKRATIMRAPSPPARPGLASESPLWRRNSASAKHALSALRRLFHLPFLHHPQRRRTLTSGCEMGANRFRLDFLGPSPFRFENPDYERWILLDFLGSSRANRDLSMG